MKIEEPSDVYLEGLWWESHGIIMGKVLCQVRNTLIRQGTGPPSRFESRCSAGSFSPDAWEVRGTERDMLISVPDSCLLRPRGAEYSQAGPPFTAQCIWTLNNSSAVASVTYHESWQSTKDVSTLTDEQISTASWKNQTGEIWSKFCYFDSFILANLANTWEVYLWELINGGFSLHFLFLHLL